MISFLATTLTMVAALTAATPTPRPIPTGEEAKIYAMHEKFAETWNRHDIAGLGAMWTEEGTYGEPDGRTTFSRAAVQQLLGVEHASVFKNSRLSLVVEHVRFIVEGVAIADGTYELFDALDLQGRPIGTRSGYFTTVLVKKNGAWMVSAARLMLPQVLIWRERE